MAPLSSSIRSSICTTLMALIHHFVRPLMGFQLIDRWPRTWWELHTVMLARPSQTNNTYQVDTHSGC